MPIVDKWVDIYSDLRVWSEAREIHKMDWLRAGDRIHLSDQYKTWFRFDQVIGGADLEPLSDDYGEYWVKGPELEVATTSPVPEPEGESGDAELGAAFRVVFDFIFKYLRGWA